MPGAHAAVLRVLGGWQHAARCFNPPIADDDRLVVEGCIGVKDGTQKFGSYVGVDGNPSLNELLQASLALKDDERPVAPSPQPVSRPCHLIDHSLHGFFLSPGHEEVAGAPQPLHGTPQLGLKDDRNGDKQRCKRVPDQPTESREGQQLAHQKGNQRDQHHATQELDSLGSLRQREEQEKENSYKQNINNVKPLDVG
jgi:hypothetical protein